MELNKKMKICSKCKVQKPLSEFYNQPLGKLNVQSYCKECSKKYRVINNNKIQEYMLQLKYHIGIKEYKQMLKDDRIKAFQHKQYIDQVKSKKMLFVSSPGTINNPRNIQSTKNTLRSMSFH